MAGHERGVVEPVRLLRARGEDTIEGAKDRAEVAMVYAHHDGTACVVSPRLRPFSGDPREIADVECNHDPALLSRECEQVVVTPTVQRAFLVRRPDVMATQAERCTNAARR